MAVAALAAARQHLELEELDGAAGKAEEALGLFTAAQSYDGAADAVRTTVHVHSAQGQDDVARELAKRELTAHRAEGGRPGAVARMQLAVAEACASARGGSNSQHMAEALRLASEAQVAFKEQGNKALEADALLTTANLQLKGGTDPSKSFEAALAAAKLAVDLYLSAKDRKGYAMAVHAVAVARIHTDNIEGGIRTAKDALRVLLELGNKRLQVFELQCISMWLLQTGQVDKALPFAEDAWDIVTEDKLAGRWHANALNTLVQCLCYADGAKKAVQIANEAAVASRAIGDKYSEASALDCLCSAHLTLQDAVEALKAAEGASKLWRAIGNKQEEAMTLRLISRLQCERSNYNEALRAAKNSVKIFRELESRNARAEALNAAMEVMGEAQQYDDAVKVALEERALCQKNSDTRGEAVTMLVIAGVHCDSATWDAALQAGETAQELFVKAEDKFGQAAAMQMVAHIHMSAQRQEEALQTANAVLPLLLELDDKRGQVGMLLLVAQATTLLLVASGGEASSKPFKEAARRSVAAAKEGVQLARKLDSAVLGSGLCMLAQACIVYASVKDAEEAAREAVQVFNELEDKAGEAYALLMLTNALIVGGKGESAREEARKAIEIFQDSQDVQGQALAESALGVLDGGPLLQRSGGAVSLLGPGASAVARVDEDLLKQQVRRTVVDIVGMDDLADDTPLMNTGLTSQSAVLLRNALTKEHPGASLPFTMMFDYPSINELTNFFVERAR